MPIESTTYNGVPAGMNLAKPAFELADNEARYLQDILLDYPGLTRRRGPVQAASGFPVLPNPGSALFGTLNPAGSYRIAALDGDNSNGYLRLLNSAFAAYDTYTWNGAMPHVPPNNPYRITDTKPALTGGVFVGSTDQYFAAAPVQNLAMWRGGDKDDYTAGTITLNRASTQVTGIGTSWLTQASSGMFLFATFDDTTAGTGKYTLTYIGIIKSIESDTTLTLGAINPFVQSAASLGGLAYSITSVRGVVPRNVKGRVTGTTASAILTGANTKFLSQGIDDAVITQNGSTHTNTTLDGLTSTSLLKRGMRVAGVGIAANTYISTVDSGTAVTLSAAATDTATKSIRFMHAHNVYRASDLSWIGRLGSPANATAATGWGCTSDTSMTLAANAAVAMNNERFIMFKMTGDWSISNQRTDNVGFLNATYSSRQWYANNGQRSEYTSRVWFSDPADPEGLDLAAYDGDFIDINSSIGTDAPIKSIMPAYNALVVIKENETFAILGSTPSTFSVKKIEDDGCFSGTSAVAYGGGVIWAGKDGIHYYDGITVKNISADKLGDYYKNAVRNVNPTQYRMWGMMLRDHYFLFIENYAPNVAVVKGTFSVTPSSVTIAINMVSQAVTFISNLPFRASVETPADSGKKSLYILNTSTAGYICQGYDLFDVDGVNDALLGDAGLSATTYRYGETSLNTTTPPTTFACVADTKYVSSFTILAPCAVTSVSVYMGGIGGGATTGGARAILYADAGVGPTTRLGESVAQTVSQGDQPGYITFTFTTPVEVPTGTLDIGIHTEKAISNLYVGAVANKRFLNSDVYAGGATDPFGANTQSIGPLVLYATVKSAGPDFFMESKKYTEGDAMRKKLFKQLAMNYICQGGALRLDTVVGMNAIGKTSLSTYPASVYSWDLLAAALPTWDALAGIYASWDAVINAVFRPKRIKFLKRSQMLAFRVWQESPAVSRVQLGPFGLGYKWQRVGKL
jgi:hypothetical protein